MSRSHSTQQIKIKVDSKVAIMLAVKNVLIQLNTTLRVKATQMVREYNLDRETIVDFSSYRYCSRLLVLVLRALSTCIYRVFHRSWSHFDIEYLGNY